MKQVLLLAAALFGVASAGCADDPADPDDGTGPTPPGTGAWSPEDLPSPVAGWEHLANPETNGSTGIYAHDGKVYLSGGSGLRIYDIRDPTNATLLASDVEGTTGSRDVDIMVHPNGRTYAVLAHGGSGISFTDVTDPTAPFAVSQVDVSAHNIAVVPNSTLVYNSRSISTHTPTPGTTGQIDIVDFVDPEAPTVSVFAFPAVATTAMGPPKVVTATTCHDVTFTVTEAHQRAYCAGVTETHVWDISDPAAPVILQVIHTPLNQIHHGAWGARGGDLLIIGDEVAGAAAPVPNCLDPAPNPYAQLWFWDISDLAIPVPLGFYQISHNTPAEDGLRLCTTHFGTLVEDRDLFVIGWYSAGTALIDFSNPMLPQEVAHFLPDGANVWDAWYYQGHVYTGDTGRGMDILRLT